MRRITVDAYQIALIMKRGRILRILTEGKYWIACRKEVQYFGMTKPLEVTAALSLLLEDSELNDMLDIITVEDYEIGIEMRDGLYSRMLTPGQYAYWKGHLNYDVRKLDMRSVEVPDDIPKQILTKQPLLSYIKVYVVESYQTGILYIDGEYQKILEPGIYYFLKSVKVASVVSVDMRLRSLEVLGQEILTKDKVGIRVNIQAQYKVIDIEKAIRDAKDYEKQLYILLQIAVREYIGSMTIDQLLANKEKVGGYIIAETKAELEMLGVEILTGGIKDIILPGAIKEIMNQVLIAQKKAQANTIMRQEETASTRSLLNTAKLMEDNSMLLKLKEMEYMEKIADKVGEISVSANGRVIDQLNDLLVTTKS